MGQQTEPTSIPGQRKVVPGKTSTQPEPVLLPPPTPLGGLSNQLRNQRMGIAPEPMPDEPEGGTPPPFDEPERGVPPLDPTMFNSIVKDTSAPIRWRMAIEALKRAK